MIFEAVLFDGDYPSVEVWVDGAWLPGEVRAWFLEEEGWSAHVSYSTKTGETSVDTVPAEWVRPVARPGHKQGHETSEASQPYLPV